MRERVGSSEAGMAPIKKVAYSGITVSIWLWEQIEITSFGLMPLARISSAVRMESCSKAA